MSVKEKPASLIEAVRYFSDLDISTEFVAKLRWPNGPVCPRCGCVEYSYLRTRRLWKCKGCKRQYSVKVGTIFEDSPLGLDKWLPAIWLIANSKNGISSHELGRALGITQKSAWFVLHRIRLAMQTGTFNKLDGAVEHIEPGAAVYTDALPSYSGLSADFEHATVDHAERYVDGQVHTNGIENFWSLLKRGLHGTYVSVEPFHLFRYLDERVFTYNMRGLGDYGRFEAVMHAAFGRRLTYAEVTGR